MANECITGKVKDYWHSVRIPAVILVIWLLRPFKHSILGCHSLSLFAPLWPFLTNCSKITCSILTLAAPTLLVLILRVLVHKKVHVQGPPHIFVTFLNLEIKILFLKSANIQLTRGFRCFHRVTTSLCISKGCKVMGRQRLGKVTKI